MNALKYIAGKLFSNDKEVLTEDSVVDSTAQVDNTNYG